MWGLIPAAGAGSRIQPLACSKELLPVGARRDGAIETPRAISEYLLDRMKAGGARKFCFVIAPEKQDIIAYYGRRVNGAGNIVFALQPRPAGLCDALFRGVELVRPDEEVLVGLPDTLWFPHDGFAALPGGRFSFLLFPVETPSFFDAVALAPDGRVTEVEVKAARPSTHWIWGGFRLPGAVFHELYGLWKERRERDEYFGTLVNAWIAGGGEAWGVRGGERYVDVGTLAGYRQAISLLSGAEKEAPLGEGALR